NPLSLAFQVWVNDILRQNMKALDTIKQGAGHRAAGEAARQESISYFTANREDARTILETERLFKIRIERDQRRALIEAAGDLIPQDDPFMLRPNEDNLTLEEGAELVRAQFGLLDSLAGGMLQRPPEHYARRYSVLSVASIGCAEVQLVSLAGAGRINEAIDLLDFVAFWIGMDRQEQVALRKKGVHAELLPDYFLRIFCRWSFKILEAGNIQRPQIVRLFESVIRFVQYATHEELARKLILLTIDKLRQPPAEERASFIDLFRKEGEDARLMDKGVEAMLKFERGLATEECVYLLRLILGDSVGTSPCARTREKLNLLKQALASRPRNNGEDKLSVLSQDIPDMEFELSVACMVRNFDPFVQRNKEAARLVAALENAIRHEPEGDNYFKEFCVASLYRIAGNIPDSNLHLLRCLRMSAEAQRPEMNTLVLAAFRFLFAQKSLKEARPAENNRDSTIELVEGMFGRLLSRDVAQEALSGLFRDIYAENFTRVRQVTEDLAYFQKLFVFYLIALASRLYALGSLGDDEGIKRAMLGILRLDSDTDVVKNVLFEIGLYLLFVPESAKERIGNVLVSLLQGQELNPQEKELLAVFLADTRSRPFYLYLCLSLSRLLNSEPQNGLAPEQLFGYLGRFYSSELVAYLGTINPEQIANKELRRQFIQFRACTEEVAMRDPDIVLPQVEQLFQSGAYTQVQEKVRAYRASPAKSAQITDEFTGYLERISRIESLTAAARKNYGGHRYADALTNLNEVMALNPQDPAAHSFSSRVRGMIEADGLYHAGNFTQAEERALQVRQASGTKKELIEVTDEFIRKVRSFARARGLIENNPDETRRILEGILQEFPDDTAARSLLAEIKAVLKKRNQSLEEARQAVKSGNFGKARDLYLVALKMSRNSKTAALEIARFLESIIKAGHYELAYSLADELLKLNPAGAPDFEKSRKASLAQLILLMLAPHYQIVATHLAAQEHEQRRIKEGFGGYKFFYSSCQLPTGYLQDTLTVRSLFYRLKNGPGNDRLSVSPRDIARKGDTFIFLDFDGKIACDDYFEVEEVGDRFLVFKVETPEQAERARTCIREKGYIMKTEDVTLLRQRDALEEVMASLRGSCERASPSTGSAFLDTLFGLKRRQINDTQDGNIQLLDPRVRLDAEEFRAFQHSINLHNEVTLIQGPPGTGKTTTITEIVNYFINRQMRVLVVSQANPAVNKVGKNLLDAGLSFVRVGNREENISEELFPSWQKRGEILGRIQQEYERQKKGFVILGTNNGYLNDKFVRANGFFQQFDVVIVEEAGRATIAETIIPILLAKQKVVLVGDHVQLPPFGICEEMVKMIRDEAQLMDKEGHPLQIRGLGRVNLDGVFSAGNLMDFKISLFQRAFELEAKRGVALDKHTLLVNYRSHPLITGVVNISYAGALKCRDYNKPEREMPEADTLKLIDIAGTERTAGSGNSSLNIDEVNVVLEELDRILNQRNLEGNYRYHPGDVTVISPYKAQNHEILLALRLKACIDRIRFGERGSIILSEEEKEILFAALRQDVNSLNRQSRDFVLKFVNDPFPSSVSTYLRLARFELPLSRERRLSEEEVKKIHVMINTIDSIQGEENRVVIVSLVRSNNERKIGFLGTFDGLQRINVSLSRAQEKMVVIGDFSRTLCRAMS
ncbi:MAG: hypothetical protein FJZ09_07065, partial [Candidatus Omnitrophica bacterium]|nr:hypothetical protein [Candidatus Omnitrophota bacterium]